jgi:hypothetical protein
VGINFINFTIPQIENLSKYLSFFLKNIKKLTFYGILFCPNAYNTLDSKIKLFREVQGMYNILTQRDLKSQQKRIISFLIISMVLFMLTFGVVSTTHQTEGILYDKIETGIELAKEQVLPISANATDNSMGVKLENGEIKFEGENADMFEKDSDAAWNVIFEKYRGIIIGVSGIATLTMLAAFIFNFTKLGATSGNEKERRSTITAILFTGIATALLGSVTIVMGFFYNSFKNV